MTLVRLALGFLAVTAFFLGAGWATGRRQRRTAIVLGAESLILTSLAALWFASLGHGGWIVVFLLIGMLAAGADRWTNAATPLPPLRSLVLPTLVTATRYVIAGGLLSLLL